MTGRSDEQDATAAAAAGGGGTALNSGDASAGATLRHRRHDYLSAELSDDKPLNLEMNRANSVRSAPQSPLSDRRSSCTPEHTAGQPPSQFTSLWYT